MATASKLASLPRGTGGRSSFSGHTVTVFGASGFIGRYLANRLGRIGSQLIIPYRGESYKVRHLKLCGDLGQVQLVPFHLRDEETIYNVVKHSSAVVNLIGGCKDPFVDKYGKPNFTSRDVNIAGPARIARIAHEAGVPSFIHFSAHGAGRNDMEFLQHKGESEQAVREEFPSATIFRPSNVAGNCDTFLLYFHWMCLVRKRFYLMKSKQFIHKRPVYAGDVVDAVVRCLDDPSTAGKTYDLLGPNLFTFDELARLCEKTLSLEYKPVLVPDVLFPWFSKLHRLTILRHGINAEKVQFIYNEDKPTPGSLGFDDLNIKPTDMEEYMTAHFRRFRDSNTRAISIAEIPGLE